MNTVCQQYIGRHYHVTEEQCATDFLSFMPTAGQSSLSSMSEYCAFICYVYTARVANVHRQGCLKSQNIISISFVTESHHPIFFEMLKFVFPLQALPCALGFITMTPGLVPHDDVNQELLFFTVTTCHVTDKDIHTSSLLLLCLLHGHPYCKNLADLKAVIHCCIRSPLTNI